MIDFDTIEDVDEYDCESVHAYGCDAETGEWHWAWIPVESLYEAGRADVIEDFGLISEARRAPASPLSV